MSKKQKPKKCRSLCSGCYNQDYWYGLGGAKECWSFKGSKVVKRLPVDVDRPPPYDKEDTRYMLSCYNRKRMVYVDPKVLTPDGYWKF